MSLPRYREYVQADVEWLEELPSTWSMSRLGFEAWVRARLGWKGLKADEYVEDGFAFLSTPDIRSSEITFDGVARITEERYLESPEIMLRADDVLLAKDGSTLGSVNQIRHLPEPATVNGSIAVITPGRRLISRYLYFLLGSAFVSNRIQMLKGGMGVPHLFQDDIRRFDIPVPPLAEQRAICGFLDPATSKIDALIAKQRQLIATLREDRAATITHAVTKGLDPDVAVADSDVEWLGEIPFRWTALRIKNVVQSVTAGTSVNAAPWPAEAGDIGVLKTSCVSAGSFNPAENKAVLDDDEIDRVTCPVRADSLIVNRANTPLLVGSAGYVANDLGNIYLSDKLWQVRFRGASARFIYYWTQTEQYRSQIAALCVGASSSMQNLAMVDFRNIALALPPVDEQAVIVRFLADRTNKIDKLVNKSNDVIEALKEYRSALITDAVTGKIDVREAAA